jgi:TonB family protein
VCANRSANRKGHMMALVTNMIFFCQLFVTPVSAGSDVWCDSSESIALADPAPLQDPDVLPVPIFKAARVYPESARKDSLQGTVWVEAIVDPSGHVQDAKIKSGVRSDLDDAALTCVRQWYFKPAMQKGKPVSCTIEIPFHFRLRRDAGK